MIILISGRAGEGKTTFANLCVEKLRKEKMPAKIFSFAKGLKDTALYMGWDGEKDKKGRRLLQQIGGVGREYSESIWADRAVGKIEDWLSDVANGNWFALIDDWRFGNEGNVILDSFFPVLKVRMIRPYEYHTLRGSTLYDDVSEIGLPSGEGNEKYYDVLVHNKEMDDLINTMNQFVERHLLGGK